MGEISSVEQQAIERIRPERLLSYVELVGLPQGKQIVKNLIGEKEVGVIYGVSTAGKSFLALDLLHHIANGRDWFGYRINQSRPVVYFALEGKGGISKRMLALEQRHGMRTLGNLNFMVQPFDLASANQIEVWSELIRDAGLDHPVIAVDTVAQASVGIDENSSEGMGRVIAGAQKLSELTSGTVILIHHAGKDTSRGARGWSGLKGAMEFQIEVNLTDKGERSWKSEKVKDHESGKTHPFSLEKVTLYVDEDGDPVTSCLIRVANDFDHHKPTLTQLEDQVWRFIGSKVDQGQQPTARSLRDELSELGMTRQDLEGAIARLKAKSRLEDRQVPKKPGERGGKPKYLFPLGWESVFVNQDSEGECLTD